MVEGHGEGRRWQGGEAMLWGAGDRDVKEIEKPARPWKWGKSGVLGLPLWEIPR